MKVPYVKFMKVFQQDNNNNSLNRNANKYYCFFMSSVVIGSSLCYPESVSSDSFCIESSPEKVFSSTKHTQIYATENFICR
ncbi:unnamed protein product [Colias eurytheme]|nr:unnamed protein product [Colias eurytheme]